MKIVGLIAEYNPFHNGHFYHIEKAKEITGADAAIVIMSGDYVQRGLPAIMPKRLRAKMALQCGASAVFELPVCYATGTAELFAEGAISFFDHLGIVDAICFGTECNDIDSLKELAQILCEEPADYRLELQNHLKNGDSFPSARQKAIATYTGSDTLASDLEDPNNILGIEYCKALHKFQSPMKAYTIQREGAHYHEEQLQKVHSSATAIRSLLNRASEHYSLRSTSLEETCSQKIQDLESQVPAPCFTLLKEQYGKSYPVNVQDFSLLLKYKLLNKTPETLSQYMDVSEAFANRIFGKLNYYLDYPQFSQLLKTKEITQTRVNRALLHIMLGIKTEDVICYKKQGYHGYAHLLGVRKEDQTLLSILAKNSSLPLLTKLYASDHLTELWQHMLRQDILASNLYASVITDRYKTAYENEYYQGVLKV